MKLNIDNFKSFTNAEWDFSRINILIGENSSGKSSLIKFLLLLKQSINTGEKGFKTSGELVDLGLFSDFASNRDNEIVFKVLFDKDDKFKDYYIRNMSKLFDSFGIVFDAEFLKNRLPFMSDDLSMIVKVSLKNEYSSVEIEIESEKIGKIFLTSNEEVEETLDVNGSKKIKIGGNLHFTDYSDGQIIEGNVEIEPLGFARLVLKESVEELVKEKEKDIALDKYTKMSYLLIVQNHFLWFLIRLSYNNPIFSVPQRYYKHIEETKTKSLTNQAIIDLCSKMPKDEQTALMNKLSTTLKDIGVGDEIRIRSLNKLLISFIEVKVDGKWRNLVDVGCGVSLVVPLLLQAILINDNGGSTIMIEQPEIHLHPSLQAKLIDVLIRYGKKNRYIIETHSEHIVRKLQAIAKKNEHEVSTNDVNIYYFTKVGGVSKINYHEVLENGRIQPNFPSGFFDSSYLLAKELR